MLNYLSGFSCHAINPEDAAKGYFPWLDLYMYIFWFSPTYFPNIQ